MQSPRFSIRATRLEKVLKPTNLQRTWKKKVRIAMRNQYIQDPIEYFDFHINSKIECEKLFSSIMRSEYIPSSGHRVLSEKSKGLCRQIVVPSVRDALVLQCLSDAMYADVKGKAPTNKAFFEPKDHGFSSNKDADYGTFSSWMNFQKEIFKFSQTRKYIVVTDISNYYDSISYSHLRNIISVIDGMEECVLDMLLYVLSGLLWQPDYMPRIEVGLPQIDLDAPRLLAHCFLYELDEYISKQFGGDFTRFMDDIDVGVDSINDAKLILRGIDLVLQTRQVRLNSGKTKILNRSEAIRHFRIWDNARIDAMDRAADFAISAGLSLEGVRISVKRMLLSGIKRKSFDDGNGSKILKRLIGLAGKVDCKIPLPHLEKIMMLRPDSREAVYSYISKSPLTLERVGIIGKFVKSGSVVDNASILEISNILLESVSKSIAPVSGGVLDLINEMRNGVSFSGNYMAAYASIWLGSKYENCESLLEFISSRRDFWFSDESMGRLIGGLHPIFFNTESWEKFKSLIVLSRNEGARSVFKFHENIRGDVGSYKSMRPFLSSPNKSKTTGITHAKFLCLISALGNEKIPDVDKEKLVKENARVWNDAFYRRLAKRSSGIKSFA